MEIKERSFKDPLEGYPQTIFEKLRRKILLSLSIEPGIIGEVNDSNLRKLTKAKASTIVSTKNVTGREVDLGVRDGD